MSRMPWRDPEGGAPMSLRRLLALSGSLEILAGLLALISPTPVVSFHRLKYQWSGIAAVLTRLLARGCSRWGRHA